MRLSTLQSIIKNTVDALDIDSVKSGNPPIFTINNWENVHKNLFILHQIPLFHDSIDAIFRLAPHISSNISPLNITSQQYSAIASTISKVKLQCETILSLESTLDLQEENTINIKLPKMSDLKELESVVHRIDQSFSQCPVFQENIGLKLLSLDHGSEWIVLGVVVGGAVALKPLADFLKSVFEMRKTIAETEKIKKETLLVDMQIEEKNSKVALDAIQQYEQLLLENRCKQIAQAVNPGAAFSPEQMQQLVLSIKTLAKLMNEGMEIYPSDTADEELIQRFPQRENPTLLSAASKLLAEPSEE